MRAHRPTALSCLTAAATAGALSLGTAGASAATVKRLGTRAPVPASAQAIGGLAATSPMTVTVTLQPNDAAALSSFVTQVSTPGSAAFHDYLTPAQFAQRFGATPAEVAATRGALAADGLILGTLSPNHLSFSASGTAAQVQRAFSVTLTRYQLAGGRIGYAPTAAPAVPAALASDVQGVLGLDTLQQAQRLSLRHARPLATPHARGNASSSADAVSPCSAATSAASQYGAYTPNELAGAYDFDGVYSGGDTGAGTTVALYELEPHLASDISAYQSCMGTSSTVTNTTVDGGAGTGAGQGEAALDIEDVIGLAPGASIDVYTGPNTASGG